MSSKLEETKAELESKLSALHTEELENLDRGDQWYGIMKDLLAIPDSDSYHMFIPCANLNSIRGYINLCSSLHHSFYDDGFHAITVVNYDMKMFPEQSQPIRTREIFIASSEGIFESSSEMLGYLKEVNHMVREEKVTKMSYTSAMFSREMLHEIALLAPKMNEYYKEMAKDDDLMFNVDSASNYRKIITGVYDKIEKMILASAEESNKREAAYAELIGSVQEDSNIGIKVNQKLLVLDEYSGYTSKLRIFNSDLMFNSAYDFKPGDVVQSSFKGEKVYYKVVEITGPIRGQLEYKVVRVGGAMCIIATGEVRKVYNGKKKKLIDEGVIKL